MFELENRIIQEVARVAPKYIVTPKDGMLLVQDPRHTQGAVAISMSDLRTASEDNLEVLIPSRVYNAIATLRNGNRHYAADPSENMELYEERKLADDVARMEKDEEERYRE